MNLVNTLAFSAYYDKRWSFPEILKCVPSISAWQIMFHSKCQSNNEPSSFSWTALNKAEFRPCLSNSSLTGDSEKIQVITRLGWVCRHPSPAPVSLNPWLICSLQSDLYHLVICRSPLPSWYITFYIPWMLSAFTMEIKISLKISSVILDTTKQ